VLALPSPSPTAPAGTPAPQASPAQGLLFVSASPWAWVAVDGLHVGETPFRPIPLPPGAHDVQLTYPAYRPFHRRVVIRAGETFTLRHDWNTMGVRVSR
jgi:PEGA domain-containing protein